MPFFSIIVPIYKTEFYLKKCLESVRKQNFTDFECIMIDDCTPDNCASICSDIAFEDNRFKYIKHSINSGQSEARNTGLSVSTGEYIMFLDSDDYFFEGALESVALRIKKTGDVDMIQMRCVKVAEKGYTIDEFPLSTKESDTVISGNSFIKQAIPNNLFHVMVWSYVFNRDFLRINNLRFKTGMTQEDDVFTTACIIRAKNIAFVNKITYAYLERKDSIMSSSKRTINSADLLKACAIIEEDAKYISDSYTKKLIMNQIVENMITAFFWGKYVKSSDFNSLFNISFMKENSFLKKTKRKVFMLRLNKRLCYFLISVSQRKKNKNE